MISTSRKIHRLSTVFVLSVFLFALLAPVFHARAQSALALSVTPTLFEMSANPGQTWKSSVKVINSNPYDLTVYADVVNFAPQGERGQGKLLPVFEEMTEGATLAEWIDIASEPVTIAQEQSASIPFIVEVPEDASPGGHFAAILISTQPPEQEDGMLSVRTTQIVTSLFFVRIAGDVSESGSIRSFTADKKFSDISEATLFLRFENKGNVHLQPRGDITIYNMWGQERGKIPINHKTNFGNVLPDSVRMFEFTWKGESSFADFGRYKAVASLAYGLSGTQFTSSATYFWVIPFKPIMITLGSVIAFILFMSWAIKLYVRRMLTMAGVPLEKKEKVPSVQEADPQEGDIQIRSYKTLSAPVRSGYTDLRGRLEQTRAFVDVLRALLSFVGSYRIFFVSAIVVLIALVSFVYFIQDATEEDRSYEVSIENPGSSVELNSEEILYEEEAQINGLPALGSDTEQTFILALVNTSGVAGTAAHEALSFVRAGYVTESITTGEGRVDKKSIIVFDPEAQNEAVKLSKKLGGALLSARTASSTGALPNITVFIGKDRVAE